MNTPSNIEEAKHKIESMRQPAIRIITSKKQKGFSKIGGLPNLPNDLEWPTWKSEHLAFVAQIDLSEIPVPSAITKLPTSGYLFFFYDKEQSTAGFDPNDRGSWSVLYSTQAPPQTSSQQPSDLGKAAILPTLGITLRQISSVPDYLRIDFIDGLSNDSKDDVMYWMEDQRDASFEKQPHHQIGGYPHPIQDDSMELESQFASNGIDCGEGFDDPRTEALADGANDWILLLQLASDEKAGIEWGDGGMLYFWIRKQDLQPADFSNVWMILQCF